MDNKNFKTKQGVNKPNSYVFVNFIITILTLH